MNTDKTSRSLENIKGLPTSSTLTYEENHMTSVCFQSLLSAVSMMPLLNV